MVRAIGTYITFIITILTTCGYGQSGDTASSLRTKYDLSAEYLHPTDNRNTKAAIAATIMAVPAFGMPSKGIAQEGTRVESMHKMPSSSKIFLKYETNFEKMKGWVWLAGVGDGHTVYQNQRNEFFYIDPASGDMKFLSDDYFYKGDSKDTKRTFVMPHILEKSGTKVSTIKMEAKVRILGVDNNGNVIQENAKGEKFYLSPTNGDMIFVK